MTKEETVTALRENANALRRLATRKSVTSEDEGDLRLVAGNLDAIALEEWTHDESLLQKL